MAVSDHAHRRPVVVRPARDGAEKSHGRLTRFCRAILLLPLVPVLALAASGTSVGSPPQIPPAQDLQADGLRAKTTRRPVVVLFSLPGCRFCDEIRHNYLAPLLRDAAPGQTPIIREIVLTGARGLVDFSGVPVTESALSKHYGVRVAPTVVMLGAAGELLAPTLIGGDTAGFYDEYLQQALADASRRMGGS